MVSKRQSLTAGVRAARTDRPLTCVSTGTRSRAPLARVQEAAYERRRSDIAVGLTRVGIPGCLCRPMWWVTCVVGGTQRRPGGREKEERQVSSARNCTSPLSLAQKLYRYAGWRYTYHSVREATRTRDRLFGRTVTAGDRRAYHASGDLHASL